MAWLRGQGQRASHQSTSRGHEIEPVYEVERSQMARVFQAFPSEGPPTFKLQDEEALAAYAYCENVLTGVEELPQLGPRAEVR